MGQKPDKATDIPDEQAGEAQGGRRQTEKSISICQVNLKALKLDTKLNPPQIHY